MVLTMWNAEKEGILRAELERRFRARTPAQDIISADWGSRVSAARDPIHRGQPPGNRRVAAGVGSRLGCGVLHVVRRDGETGHARVGPGLAGGPQADAAGARLHEEGLMMKKPKLNLTPGFASRSRTTPNLDWRC